MYAHYQLLALPQVYLHTFIQHSILKPARSKKVRNVSKGGGGCPEERPYDVSRGQNRYVTLPLVKKLKHNLVSIIYNLIFLILKQYSIFVKSKTITSWFTTIIHSQK